MKCCINMIVAIIAFTAGSYVVASSLDQLYTIVPTTVGDDSIVHAIKHYSNITPRYVNSWKPLDLWIVGPAIRTRIIKVINNYIHVCKSLKLGHVSFSDEESLRAEFPINWSVGALCLALNNLKEQGIYALTLIAQIGTDNAQAKGLEPIVTYHLSIIDHNRQVFKSACTALVDKRIGGREKTMQGVLAQATLNEKKWKNVTAQAKIVQDIKIVADVVKGGVLDVVSGNVFTSTSLPVMLLGAALYWTGVLDTSNELME